MANITKEIFRELGDAVSDGIIPKEALAGIAKKDDAKLGAILSKIREIRALEDSNQESNMLTNEEEGLFKYDLDYKGQSPSTLSLPCHR